MAGVSGSIRKVTINGITYNAASDANLSKTPTETNESVRHSGGNMKKKTLMHGDVESVTLICTPSEYEALEDSRDAIGDIPLSYELADTSIYRTSGYINLDNYESEENRVDVTLCSSSAEWQSFSAS